MALGTPGTTPNSTLDANAFSKCAPSLRTNIRQCGTVTQMNAAPMTIGDLDVFQKSSDFRVMDALFRHDLEIKMCESVQNGLYDFMMAQRVNMSRKMRISELTPGRFEIAPFIKAKQYSPINDEYWLVSGGVATSGAAVGGETLTNGVATDSNWRVDVVSTTNIPIDLNYFPVGLRVFIQGKSTLGSATQTAWKVTGNLLSGSAARLYLDSENAASNLLPYLSDKLAFPETGILTRGTPNVNDFEKWCNESPTVLHHKLVPFWVETTRYSMCWSSLYEKWRAQVLSNGLFREFFDLDETEKNKQLGRDWQKRFVRQMFYGKPLANQTLSDYDSLEEIEAFDGSLIGQTTGQISELGVDGGAVIARRANAVGIYEQLAECDRIVDLQGAYPLNLPNLFNELYNMMRVREGNGHGNPKAFDIFTDSVTAELINQAMLLYYKQKSQDMLSIDMNAVGAPYKKAEFGFLYRSYMLFYPPGVTINVITHYFFDDLRSAGLTFDADDNTTRVLWVLDFSGIYPAILASNRKVHNTGDLEKLASISPDYACVMATNTKRQTLTSLMWTMIVECPASNLIVENFTSAVPEYATASGPSYPPATSTTSSTTVAD
jgi:hypothetical protein